MVVIKLFSHKKKSSLNFEVTRLLIVSDKQKYNIRHEISKTFLLNDYMKLLCHITQKRDVWVFFFKKVKYVHGCLKDLSVLPTVRQKCTVI